MVLEGVLKKESITFLATEENRKAALFSEPAGG